MALADDNRTGPRSAIVVGAGIVGLSTAWFLQERGVSVTVVDRTGVAAGASWGNAGWIAPALSAPLNVLHLDEARVRDVFGASVFLLRPDLHIAWRGDAAPPHPTTLAAMATGRAPVA